MIVEFFNLSKANAGHLQAIYHLARKYLAQRVLLACRDMEQVKTLDEQLWTYEPAAFLPHGVNGEPDCAQEPILLSADFNNLNRAKVLILAYNPPEGWLPPKNFQRVVELLPIDEGPALTACRNRYRILSKQSTLEHTVSL